MGIWQVQLWGEGFLREGKKSSFELSGIVEASSAEEAFKTAVSLAKQVHPELAQAEHLPGPGAVINADEIEEFPNAPKSAITYVELFWI